MFLYPLHLYPIVTEILRSEIGKMSGVRLLKMNVLCLHLRTVSICFMVYRLHFQDIFKMNGLKLDS